MLAATIAVIAASIAAIAFSELRRRQGPRTLATPNLKEAHEQSVCERFLALYNKQFGTTYKFLKAQKPRAPDCLCSDDLNIEAVTAYYDATSAKDRHDLARGRTQAPTMRPWISNVDLTGGDAIDRCISEKATKTYTYTGKLWLVVEVHAELSEWDDDIQTQYLNSPRVVPHGPFGEIWLIMGDWAGDHIGRVALK